MLLRETFVHTYGYEKRLLPDLERKLYAILVSVAKVENRAI
jgi:hypothetical protein